MKIIINRNLAILLLTICLLVGCSHSNEDLFTVSSQNDLFNNVPKANRPEVRAGYSIHLRIISEVDIVTDSATIAPVKKMGKRLAQHANRRGFPYDFTVIDDSRIFAISIAGGYIYISKGMLDFVESENELAAVLAHEIGETQRRPIKYTKRKHIMQMVQGLSQYATFVNPAGFLVPKGVKLVNNVLLRDPSPLKTVIEADEEAVDYLMKEHIDPSNLLMLIKKIATSDASYHAKIDAYLRLRPISEKRVLALKERLRSIQEENNQKE